jgi:tRNA modification GTPase
MKQHMNDSRRGEKMRSGARLAIIGPPNAGKSRMMNYLGMQQFTLAARAVVHWH